MLTSGREYDTVRTLWNGAVTSRPFAVLRCATTADVQAGVRIARERGLSLSVRGGGHDWAGRALVDGGLVLDLSPMRQVSVDPAAAVATVAGGATSADVAEAAQRNGLIAVTGTAGSVGMAGLTLGGGYGPLSGRFGLAADNLLSADVVLADGTLVTADEEHDPELLWALRGGGGNFGVVTTMRIRLHAVPSILAGMIMFSFDALPDLEESLLRGPDELTVQAGFITSPTGEPVLFAAPTWCGEPEAGAKVLHQLTELGEPLMAQVGPTTMTDQLAQIDAMFPPGRHVEIGTRTVTGLDRTVQETLIGAASTKTSPLSAISLHSLHGAAARVPADATAFRNRAPHLMVETIAVWEAGDPDEDQHRAWVRGTDRLPGGYPNLLGPEDVERTAAVFGPNAERLLTAKQRYDPDLVFHAPGSFSNAHAPQVLRPLGAFERIIDLYISRNPVQFSLAVELAAAVSAQQLERALADLQKMHPLLAAGIDRTGDRPTFRGSAELIPLRQVHSDDWREVAAEEQTLPVDADGSPLVRATLLTGPSGDRGTVVLLTFSHQIADGRGALRAAHDLLAILDGQTLQARPVPADQESLLERLAQAEQRAAPAAGAPTEPSADTPVEPPVATPVEPPVATIRPFDATAPNVEVAELDHETTERLRSAARAHASTVQGALCAAAAQALSALTGAESIRINVPIDLRSALGLEDDVVNRFTATTVVLRAPAHNTFWSLAQDATAQLRAARNAARDAALMLASFDPAGAAEAEAAMLAATTSDLEITNLGTSQPGTPSAVAVWGPTMATQVRDERILGAVTHAGSLRLTLTTHNETRGLAPDIADRLVAGSLASTETGIG